MADDHPDPDSNGDSGTPRWVYVFGTIAIIVALLFVILLLVGGGRHGPGRQSGGDSGLTPPTGDPPSARLGGIR